MRKSAGKLTGRAAACIAAAALCVGMVQPVFADTIAPAVTSEQESADEAASVYQDDDSLLQLGMPDDGRSNMNAQRYSMYAMPVYSYLVSFDEGVGGFMRVQWEPMTQKTTAEYYDSSYNLVKTKEIDQGLPVFGAFASDGTNYYILSGQENTDEKDDVEVYRVTKYDSDWNPIAHASLFGANTQLPFAFGSARMVVSNGYLLIRTCHTMYKSSDGYNHQANVTMEIDTSKMEVTDSYTGVASIGNGYVSHSFNEFIDVDGTNMVTVDHGDAYPRSVVLCKYNHDFTDGKFITDVAEEQPVTSVNMLTIPGETGNNHTGVSVGGFEQSADRYLVAGNVVDFAKGGDDSNHRTRNIFISSISKDLTGEPQVTYLTHYNEGDTSVTTPHLVKIDENAFLVFWSRDDKVNYVMIDGTGKAVTDIYQMDGSLSDCKPLWVANEVMWYAYSGDNIDLYTISLSNIRMHWVRHLNYTNHPFVDVRDTDYYSDAVTWAAKNAITSGTDETHFNPVGTTTRAQVVSFLWRAAGSPEPWTRTNSFTDVKADKYYYKAVLWAAEKGITAGTTSTTFAPDKPVTRGEMVTFLWRYGSKPEATKAGSFVDVGSNAYYKDAVAWAAENGITSGVDSTHFAPDRGCARGQVVTFMYRAQKPLVFPV